TAFLHAAMQWAEAYLRARRSHSPGAAAVLIWLPILYLETLHQGRSRGFRPLTSRQAEGRPTMLMTLGIILLVLWLLGLLTNVALGGFIHALLVIGIILVLIRLFTGRRPVA